MIFVVATIEIVPGKREAFLQEFRKIVPQVRAEQGCLEYTPTVDAATGIGAEQPVRDNTVTIVEKWESAKALKAHLVAPHMVEYRPKVKDLILDSKLHILQPI